MTEPGLIIDGHPVDGEGGEVTTRNPADGATIGRFTAATAEQLDRAATFAADAEDAFRHTPPATRAALLDAIAARLESAGDEIVQLAASESGLGEQRMRSELGRTTTQLRMYATALHTGGLLQRRDEVTGGATSVSLQLRSVGLGPVAVFAASNFPLAFSTAGGDTAAALAAGCPVLVKAHSAHVATSVRVAREIAIAVDGLGLPGGVFGHLVGGREIGMGLVVHPAIRAVGFTGSRAGGLALAAAAADRRVPIPVFAEMSSINPVFVLPGMATVAVAEGFVASLTLGAGQFCTNPGLLLLPEGPAGDSFVEHAAAAVRTAREQTMLTREIAAAFDTAVEAAVDRGARLCARGAADADANAPATRLLEVGVAEFLADRSWMDEMFGSAALIVRYRDPSALRAVAEHLDGQLTATMWFSPAETAEAMALLPVLERRAGRIIANGWPTGVAVNPAMVHGGPFPATTDSRFTAVGTLAIERFLRPISYQGFGVVLDDTGAAPNL